MRAAVVAILLAFVSAGLGSAGAGAAGIHSALTPADSTVQPGGEFTIDFSIVTADAAFNGFDVVFEYDPAKLTLLPAVPVSQQQGPLMTAGCGNTFHLFSAAGDSAAATCVLLCAGQSRTGPGRLYRLRFRAGEEPGETFVRLRAPRVRFYDAGLFVRPVETADARIQIGQLTDAVPSAPPGLSLRVWPNPSRPGSIRLSVSSSAPGTQQVTIRVLGVVPAVDRSWGRIKAAYRQGPPVG